MILSQFVGILLASGVITSGQASAVNGQAPLIGGVVMCVVTAVGYIVNRFFLKLRMGPKPGTITPESTQPTAPVSPSYAPTSTGPAPDEDVPVTEAV